MVMDVLSAMVYKKGSISSDTTRRTYPGMEPYLILPEHHMNVNVISMKNLISKRSDEIEKIVAGTGYLAKTVIGVGTFLLDNEGDVDLMTAKQKVIFEKFLLPLLSAPRR